MSDSKHNELRQQALNILKANNKGSYTVANANVYPFQWNWDAFFNALGWLRIDEERAWCEIETLCTGQWKNGMIPSIVFHEKNENYFPGPDIWQAKSMHGIDTTGITQIPVVIPGIALMYKNAQNKQLAKKKLSILYKKLFSYLKWFYTERTWNDSGLCLIFHGWESMDNSPLWDDALGRVSPSNTNFVRKDTQNVSSAQRPTQWDYQRYISIVENMRKTGYDSKAYAKISEMSIVDAALNSVVYAGAQTLLELSEEFASEDDSALLQTWMQNTKRDFDMLWDDDLSLYVDYDARTESKIYEEVSGGLVPLYAGFHGNNQQAYKSKLQKWISQDMPSVFTASKKFDASRYWRGPSWTIMNFLIYEGARKQGWHTEAEEIRDRSIAQIREAGFYECFNPLTRQGSGGIDFSWTAAMFLFWLDTRD